MKIPPEILLAVNSTVAQCLISTVLKKIEQNFGEVQQFKHYGSIPLRSWFIGVHNKRSVCIPSKPTRKSKITSPDSIHDNLGNRTTHRIRHQNCPFKVVKNCPFKT
jgi:hypothetical protein